MGLYEKLQLEGIKEKNVILEKIFELRKKNITRQNAADSNKRFEAENILKMLTDVQNLLEACSDDFQYCSEIIKIYDYFHDNDKEFEGKIAALQKMLSGDLNQIKWIGDTLRLKKQYELYNAFVDVVNSVGGTLEKIDLTLSQKDLEFEEKVKRFADITIITKTDGNEAGDGLKDVDDYLTQANADAEGTTLYETYKRIRAEAIADLMNGVMGEIEFARYKNDAMVIGMVPIGEEANTGIINFPITIHVREYGPDRIPVSFKTPISGVMAVKKWTPEATYHVISKMEFTWEGKKYLAFDRFSTIVANSAIPAVKQLFGNSIENICVYLKKGTKVLTNSEGNALLFLMIAGNNFKVNGLNLNFPKSDPMEAQVIVHGDNGNITVLEVYGTWNGNQIVNYVRDSSNNQDQQRKSAELDNLYVLARRALDNNNSTDCIRYYEQILREDPNSWEAVFFSTIARACEYDNEHIAEAARLVGNNLNTVFSLLHQSDADIANVIPIIVDYVMRLETGFAADALDIYNSCVKNDRSNWPTYISFLASSRPPCAYALYELGNQIELYYADNPDFLKYALDAWKAGVKIHTEALRNQGDKEPHQSDIDVINKKISSYDDLYTAPTSSGCYVATAVYGSYDCPEVWVLRRFRDYTLDEVWYGRVFIKLYYAVSPSLVKWFGKTRFFNYMNRKLLDSLVNRLMNNGVDDKPYHDKQYK